MQNVDVLIDMLIRDALTLYALGKSSNVLSASFDAKQTVKIGKRFNKNLVLLLKTESGIAKLNNLRNNSPNKYICFLAARYLYPLYPKQCMQTMVSYKESVTDDIELMQVSNVITGISQNLEVFVDQFKKLYNCDDLSQLNREN